MYSYLYERSLLYFSGVRVGVLPRADVDLDGLAPLLLCPAVPVHQEQGDTIYKYIQIINSAPDTPSMAHVWDRGYRFGSGWFHMTFFDMDPERTMDQNPDPGSDLFFEN